MTSNIARQVVQSFKGAAAGPHDGKQLSLREHNVLDYLVKGYSYKEAAE